MKQKIKLRLFLIAVIAVVVSTVAVTFVYYELFSRQVRQDLKLHAELLNDTELFQDMYEAEISEPDENAASDDTYYVYGSEAFARLKNENLRITWVDTDGQVLYDNDTDAAALENHSSRPEISEALKKGEGESVRRSETFNLSTFYYAIRLDNGTVLRVAMKVSTAMSMFLTAAPIILVIIIAVLGACIVIGRMLTDSIIKPIERMAEHLDDNTDSTVYAELKPFADKIRSQHEHILAASESRQDFTANVTHELKTPLTAISGYAELIENHMIDQSQETYIAGQIRHNSERLLSMINDIIELSELDHKETHREFVSFDLYAAAEECCRELKVNADARHISISCSGNTACISGDRGLIRELIENLVQNAIRYNHEGGHVWVSVSDSSGHPVLSVRDDGIGIPKEQQERVFERFYRVDKGRSRDMGGTGLGLAIVKHIAELHGARLRLDSILGEGTEITVSF